MRLSGVNGMETDAIDVQVNNRVVARVRIPVDADQAAAVAIATADPAVAQRMTGKTPRKVIYIPRRILNIIV